MTKQERRSEDLQYASHYEKVLGSKIHYLDEGKGEPMLFLHGMPTSSYLWRNIIPKLSEHARCIAPDLIGMGKSAKPECQYRIFDHIKYIDAFIKALGLKKITLVLHGWGSLIGFDYASRNPRNVKAIAFFESHVRPTTDWDMLSLPVQQLTSLFNDEKASYDAVMKDNFFIKQILPQGVLRKLTPKEMEYYSEPFKTQKSRQVLWQYLQDLPLGEGPKDVVQLVSRYSKWLQDSKCPKLMLFAVPGFITTIDTVMWCREHLPNLTLVDLNDALHFAQESNPAAFADALVKWYVNVVLGTNV